MSNCSIKVRVVAIVAITFHLPLKKSKLGRKKKKTRKNTFVYLKNRKSSLKQKKKNNKNLKPKEDPKKSHHSIETIYQSLLT